MGTHLSRLSSTAVSLLYAHPGYKIYMAVHSTQTNLFQAVFFFLSFEYIDVKADKPLNTLLHMLGNWLITCTCFLYWKAQLGTINNATYLFFGYANLGFLTSEMEKKKRV